ncbi:hypothetical protein PHET_12026 [Paragonimus heterotremus]|uniref:Uncharacterized protein n=1 Tax=Paragonimus heterotremus TaxID=100268 RepID=A0A8J4SZ94_9TREM|nr:hypothetical protein PHET_12026 [Paragonimus heterotremus]
MGFYVVNKNPQEVPRFTTSDVADYANGAQLYVFSNSSETGYGAVVHALFFPKLRQPCCIFVFAGAVTLPRLELQAVVLVGGVCERAILSARKVLHGVFKKQLFVEVQIVLNNRDLVPPTPDNRDERPLTPGDSLLIRGRGLELPAESLQQSYSRCWRLVN